MNVLITGGAGFIGSALVRRLSDMGDNVHIFDNYSRSQRIPLAGSIIGDIRRYSDLVTAFSETQFDEMIHAAAINGTANFYQRPDEVLEVGVQGTLNVINACIRYRVKRFTFFSSSEVCRYQPVMPDEKIPLMIPDPYNPRYSYSAGKIIGEMLLLHNQHLTRTIIVRPFNIFGPNMTAGHVIPDLIEQFERGETIIRLIGSGDETRSFCYIDDLVDGVMIAREKGEHKGVYNIGRESEISIAELAQFIGQIYNISPVIISGHEFREGDLPRRSPNISKLRQLGYQPKTSLMEGLKKCVLSRNAKSARAKS